MMAPKFSFGARFIAQAGVLRLEPRLSCSISTGL
jgi:hypothetical protein